MKEKNIKTLQDIESDIIEENNLDGYERIDNYNWDKIDKMVPLYKEILVGHYFSIGCLSKKGL